MESRKNKIYCRKSSHIGLLLFLATVLFFSEPFTIHARTDNGQKYCRMQMMQFLKRNIPEYYLTMDNDTDSAAYNIKSKYGISVREVYWHYLGQRTPSATQQPAINAGLSEEEFPADTVISIQEHNESAISEIDSSADKAEQSADKNEDHYLFRIYFGIGESDVKESIASNKDAIAGIKTVLSKLMTEGKLKDYHITITGMCSPEGAFISNLKLAQNRCETVESYLGLPCEAELRNECEGWQMLDDMVTEDSVLTFEQKCEYIDICEIADWDRRENAIRQQPFHEYFRDVLYPRLRVVFIAIDRCSDLNGN